MTITLDKVMPRCNKTEGVLRFMHGDADLYTEAEIPIANVFCGEDLATVIKEIKEKLQIIKGCDSNRENNLVKEYSSIDKDNLVGRFFLWMDSEWGWDFVHSGYSTLESWTFVTYNDIGEKFEVIVS